MKFKHKDVRRIYSAMLELDGRREVKKSQGEEVVVTTPYKFDSKGRARGALVRNVRVFHGPFQDTEKTREKLIAEHTDGATQISVKHENYPQFAVAWDHYMEEQIDIPASTIRYEDLDAEKNGIPASVLGYLGKILTLEGEPAPGDESDKRSNTSETSEGEETSEDE